MGACCSRKSNIISEIGGSPFLKQGRIHSDKHSHQTLIIDDRPLYKIGAKLGEGSVGIVYLIESLVNENEQFALKIINSEDPNIQEIILKEYQNMQQQRDRCIIRYYDLIHMSGGKFGLMMEYANQGSLEEFLQNPFKHSSKYGAKLCTHNLIDIINDIFQGLISIHSKKIIHSNLKPENILLSNFTAKIGDLGASKQLLEYTIKTQSIVGNILYTTPGQIKQNEYSIHNDIYAIGLIILELFFRLNKKDIIKYKIKQQPISQLINAPLSLRIFIEQGLLNNDPEKRISAEKAIQILRQLKQQQEVIDYINSFYQMKQSIPLESLVTSYLMSTDLQDKKYNVTSLYIADPSEEIKSTVNQVKFKKIKDAVNLYFEYLFDSSLLLFQDILQEYPGCPQAIVGCCINFLKIADQFGKDIDIEEISEKLEKVKQQDPEQALIYFAFAQIAILGDNFEDALQNIQACVDVGDELIQSEALALNAYILFKLKRDSLQMSQLMTKALKTKQFSSFILYYQAEIQTKLDVKRMYLDKSIEMCRQNYYALFLKGDLYLQEGQIEKAEQEYSLTLSIYSSLKHSIIQISNCYHQQKQYLSCIKYISNQVNKYGEQTEFYIILGDCYFGLGMLEQAFVNYLLYTQSILIDPNSISCISIQSAMIKRSNDYCLSHSYNMIGVIYLLHDMVENALQQFYIGAINNGISCMFSLYKFYKDIDNIDRANKLLEVIVSLKCDHYQDSIIKLIALKQLNQEDKFYENAYKLRSEFPHMKQTSNILVTQLYKDGKYQKIIELAQEMLRNNMVTQKVIKYEIYSYIKLEQDSQAINKLTEIIPMEIEDQSFPISSLQNIVSNLNLEEVDPENKIIFEVLNNLYESNPQKYFYNCFFAKFLNAIGKIEESSKVFIYYETKIEDVEYYKEVFYLQISFFNYYLKVFLQNEFAFENVYKFHLQQAFNAIQILYSDFQSNQVLSIFPEIDNALIYIQELGQRYLDSENNNNQYNLQTYQSQINIIDSLPKTIKSQNDINFISEILSSQLPYSEN